MSDTPKKSLFKAIKGKVIIALLLACFALIMAWAVSKVAFNEMLNTVENISTPSERLRMVNRISLKISRLDQLQKTQASNDPKNYSKLLKESGELRASLDSLSSLYAKDSVQLQRIGSIQKLLKERDNQFLNYLKVRERLVNNKSFSTQVQNLSEMVNKSGNDSTVLASQLQTSTTTIYSSEDKNRGFFGRLFGKKKDSEDNKSYKIINEKNLKVDTISLSNEDKTSKSLEETLRNIEKEQKRNSARFLNKEAELANANNLLINQMLDILRKVESEVVTQIELNGIQAKHVVNTGINTISVIMLVFFLLMLLMLYFILTDITRSNRYKNELEQARDLAEYHGMAKQRFLSNMSHEIRTPLQSIIGYAELIRQQEKPNPRDIDAIYHSSEHLLQIVNEVLDYNRIISGKFTFIEKPFDIAKLLEEVIFVMRPQAERKSLNLLTEISLHETKYINGDPFRLKQILYNLLGNAIKFTNEGEVVLSVFYKRQGESLHFTFMVRDTGIGISEASKAVIFNEFEQVNENDQEVLHQAGTGLGLTIIKSLIETQGGRIYVKSKEGVGSVFTVYLTFKIAEEPIEEKLSQSKDRLSWKPFKVWVVDDDPLILELCSIIFERNHIDYTSFNSPVQLLHETEEAAGLKYILLDMRMPEMNGIELCQLLRKKMGNTVKIFAITAQVLPDEREFLLNNGFDGLVMKPFRENELLAVFSEELEAQSFSKEAKLVVEDKKIDLAVTDAVADPVLDAIELDLGPLRKMTFDDEEQLKKILNRFTLDCENDLQELTEAMQKEDTEKLGLLSHRLAGRIAQIGSRNLASDFRQLELVFHQQSIPDEKSKKTVVELSAKLKQLIDQIHKL
ncbi:histidine kinase [Pedobacter sp. PACM 27299]|uniref:ATP-binding protein n=1 Tax=Pedobacter sp. PACM 27299 TaxID=1727164 RepID=UPI000706EAE1|nr:ATP-binding protein [Pedobacter sp. PACM 27299]ALL04484.1 histidine kinase [Pedobacter sp. PACM 27299]